MEKYWKINVNFTKKHIEKIKELICMKTLIWETIKASINHRGWKFIDLSAIPLTSLSHMALSSGLVRISVAILAPLIGGLEYIGRIRILIWDITRLASSLS